MKKIKMLIIGAITVIGFNSCAGVTSGTVLKSETNAKFLSGELSIGNTVYNISGENSAEILRAIRNSPLKI